jgi:hypothetical protein
MIALLMVFYYCHFKGSMKMSTLFILHSGEEANVTCNCLTDNPPLR